MFLTPLLSISDLRKQFAASLTKESGPSDNHTSNSLEVSAAVLVLLALHEGSLHTIVTKRTETVRSHKGQLSFPGGVFDAQADQNLKQTALRETFEEIGVAPSAYEIVGHLSHLSTSTGFRVAPFVALAERMPLCEPNPAEVAAIYHIKLDAIAAVEPQRFSFVHEGQQHESLCYRLPEYLGNDVIWGATARILSDLVSVLRTTY